MIDFSLVHKCKPTGGEYGFKDDSYRKPILLVNLVLAGTGAEVSEGRGSKQPQETLGAMRLEASRNQAVPTRLYVIQFKQIIRDEDRKMLQDNGLKIYNYIPDDAYVVEGSADRILELSLRPEIQAALPMMPIWKKSADLPRVSVFNRKNQDIVMVQLNQDSQGK